MRRIAGAVAVALATGVAAVPAQAHNGQDGQRAEGHHQHHGGKGHHRLWAVHGTVVSQTLAKNDDGTYSGDVVIEAKQWNRRARHGADMDSGSEQKTFALDHAKVRFNVSDKEPADGKVDEGDVVAGDRVLLAGKSDRTRQRCNHDGVAAGGSKVRFAAFADPKTDDSTETKRR